MISSGKEVWVSSYNISYNGLGSVGDGETLSRSVVFANKQVMNRVVIKFSVAVNISNI